MLWQIGPVTISIGASKRQIAQSIYDWRLMRAIKKANRLCRWHNKKYVVIRWAGRIRVVQNAILKDNVKRRTIFKKGTTMEQLQKFILYQTTR